MSGKRAEETESKASNGTQQAGAHEKLHADVYTPPLNHRVMRADGTVEPGKHGPGPKLNELTIDVDHVHIYDTPRRDDSPAERSAAKHREMPVSNEHFRDLVKQGAEFMAENDGGFNLAMRNALEEARQSDKAAGDGHGHYHVDQMLKWVNNDLSGTFYTLRRVGDKLQMFDTHESEHKPAGVYDLKQRAWEK